MWEEWNECELAPVETIHRKRKQRPMMMGMECTHSSGRATRLGGAERSLMLICVKRRGPPTCWGRSMATKVALELRYSVIPMLASFIVPYKFLLLAPHAFFWRPILPKPQKSLTTTNWPQNSVRFAQIISSLSLSLSLLTGLKKETQIQ